MIPCVALADILFAAFHTAPFTTRQLCLHFLPYLFCVSPSSFRAVYMVFTKEERNRLRDSPYCADKSDIGTRSDFWVDARYKNSSESLELEVCCKDNNAGTRK